MLDHKKIAQEIIRRASEKINHISGARHFFVSTTRRFLESLVAGGDFGNKYRVLSTFSYCEIANSGYQVFGIDASQVYPDPQFFAGAVAVINVGGIQLLYGPEVGSAEFLISSEFISTEDLIFEGEKLVFCPEMIDLMRFLREIEYGIESFLQHNLTEFSCILFDGSMLPQSLILKSSVVQRFVMQRYARALQQIQQHKIPVCWYTSSPRSSVVVAAFGVAGANDTDLLSGVLQSGEISPVFVDKNTIFFGALLDERDAPAICFIGAEDDVVKLEFPRWMYDDQTIFFRMFSVVFDQVFKGFGYPVALTEAHCQVVVTEAERQFLFSFAGAQVGQAPLKTKNVRKQIIPV